MRVSVCVWCERARGEKQLLLCLARFLVFTPKSFRGTRGLRFSPGFGLLAVRCSSRSPLVSRWMDGFWQPASTRDQEIDLAIVADDELCHTLLPSNDTGSDRGGGGDDDDGTWVRLAAKHAVPGVSRIETRLHAFEGDLVRDGQAQLPRVVLLAGQEARHVHHATQVYYAAHAAATQDGECTLS